MWENEKERKQGKGRVLRTQKEGSSWPMRDRRDGGHFNDRDKQREEKKGNRMTFQPLTLVGMHAPREYSNPFTPRNAYARGRAKGAVDQSLARALLTRKKNTWCSPPTFLPFSLQVCTHVRIHIMRMYLHMNAYRVYRKKWKSIAELSDKFQRSCISAKI